MAKFSIKIADDRPKTESVRRGPGGPDGREARDPVRRCEVWMRALSELWGLDESALDARVLDAVRATIDSHGITAPAGLSAMGGDHLLAGVCRSLTREVEIRADACEVWPWVAQLMRGAGIYGWRELETDRHGVALCRSAAHLLSDLPPPRLGDQVDRALILVALEPGRELVWSSCEPLRILGHDVVGLTVNYLVEPSCAGPAGSGVGCPGLKPFPGGDTARSTRLVARLRFTAQGMNDAAARTIGAAMDLLLIGSQLERLRENIERAPPPPGATDSSGHIGYQHARFRPALVSLRKHNARG